MVRTSLSSQMSFTWSIILFADLVRAVTHWGGQELFTQRRSVLFHIIVKIFFVLTQTFVTLATEQFTKLKVSPCPENGGLPWYNVSFHDKYLYLLSLVNSFLNEYNCRVTLTTELEKSILQFGDSGHQLLKSHNIYIEKLDNNQNTCNTRPLF